jgi:hypothetical protein
MPTLLVIPDNYCQDWFWVQSRSRPDVFHLVDVAYQDEPWRRPYAACSCEAYTINIYHMGKTCPHIKAVRRYLKNVRETQSRIATAGTTG